MNAWEPPVPDNQGRFAVGDWQPVRDAIEAAYLAMGTPRSGDIPQREWNLAVLVMSYARHAAMPTCSQCKTRIQPYDTIRCLDCKAPLCERCAPGHFWPNGRPTKTHE